MTICFELCLLLFFEEWSKFGGWLFVFGIFIFITVVGYAIFFAAISLESKLSRDNRNDGKKING